MNPSAKGWIKKMFQEVSVEETYAAISLYDFYDELKSSGFIYGNNVRVVYNYIENKDFTHEEFSKVNIILAFRYMHYHLKVETPFIDSVIAFYDEVDEYKKSFFQGLLSGKKKSYSLLEDIIEKRIAIDDNILTKNFNYFITNALLFVDVIAYEEYVRTGTISTNYLKEIETCIQTIIFKALGLKKEKTKYDESLIKLFEASFRYSSTAVHDYSEVIHYIENQLSKYYIIDLVCMTFWSDQNIDEDEHVFLNQLENDLNIPKAVIEKAIHDIDVFFSTYKDDIAFLKSKNRIQSFYDNSSNMVAKLIGRNSKRLSKELKESKELMVLLTNSTTRSLTAEEQKKVKDQLLDIFKSIPSLAIFILPGGMLLLPFVIKFIPKLLPSAFDDNRVEEDE